MKILLISDESINMNKGGFSQTLYNIFSFVKPENFLFITSSVAYGKSLPSAPFTHCTFTYDFELIHTQKNWLGQYINSIIDWVNYTINRWLRNFKKVKLIIERFDPDIVIVAPHEKEGVFMFHKLKTVLKGKKVFPYFMDDWLRQCHLKWAGGDIQSQAKQMLSENANWLMISNNLGNVLSERYKVYPKKVLEIHNPVDITNMPAVSPVRRAEQYTFAYAGSLWPMHFDSFLSVAKALKILNNKKKVHFIVYTSKEHWKWRKKELDSLGVKYGCHVPYNNIHTKLAEADFLIITSSFSKELYTHAHASIQTKLTDYLKAGRLIISCGPFYSANHEFLKKYSCGVCIETADEQKIAEELDRILENPFVGNQYVANGFQLLKDQFTFNKVHQKLISFLNA